MVGVKGNVPVQPYEAFSRSVFLLLELIEAQVLKSLGESGSSELSVADFLFIVNTWFPSSLLRNHHAP